MDLQEAELWKRWLGGRDKRARDSLVLLHTPWARLVARDVYVRIRLRGVEWGDFVQNATVGLLEAADRYDLSRGVEFRTFARHRVRGAVFNGLRQLLGRASCPTESSVAERVTSLEDEGREGDPLEAFVSMTIGLGIGHLLDEASLPFAPADQPTPYTAVERAQTLECLRSAVERIPERERMVLTLHYFQHLPFVDIAQCLGVTKGRISQLHKQALSRLREHIARIAL